MGVWKKPVNGAFASPVRHKFHISLKEGRETLYWLRILRHASPDRAKRIDVLYRECDEIVAILVASLKTSKRNEQARAKNDERGRKKNDERRTKNKGRNTVKEFWFNVPD